MNLPAARHLLICGSLLVLIESLRYALGIVDIVGATVKSCWIEDRVQSRAVLITYEFDYRGRHWGTTDVFQPRQAWDSRGWTDEERATARQYLAEHPPGTPIRVAVSRYYPWSSRILNGDQAPEPSRFGPSWVGLAISVWSYGMAMGTYWALRARWRRKGAIA
jgi:hypothetical protein